MVVASSRHILMISTHGYVAAEPEFGKPDTGGQVVYLLELSKCLANMGYSVEILTRQFEEQPAVEEVAERVRVVRLPCGGRDFIPKEQLCEHLPEWIENAARWVHSHPYRFKLINSHYWDAGIAGQTLADRFGIPHLHTPHSIGSWKRDSMGLDPAEMENKYNFKRRIQEEKVIYEDCDLIIATTPAQRDILHGEDYGVSAAKIRVIPPGYDDIRFFPVSHSTRRVIKQRLGMEGPTILTLGRIAKNKGYDLLLRGLPLIQRLVPEVRLVLAIGSTSPNGEEQEMLQSLLDLSHELGVADRVLFKDYIDERDLVDYYRAADVFTLCSRYEPFGMTAIEAMACGTPVVMTTEGGLCEQVTWGVEALYENPFDVEAFGYAVAAVLRHPRISAQLSKFGPRKARSRFTWTGIAQQLLMSLESRRPEVANEGDVNGRFDDYLAEESTWSR